MGPSTASHEYSTTTKRITLLVATMASFFTPFMGSSVNIAIPTIQQDLGIDAVMTMWIATSFLLAAAVALVPIGKLADIYGRKKIFTYGLVVFTLGSLFSGLAQSAESFIALRILHGVGSAMIFGTSVAILTSVFQPGERGRALGINVASVYLGLSLGPFLGGILTEHFGWRSIFLVTVPIGIAILILTLWKLEGEWAEARDKHFDVRGSVLYAIAVIGTITGLSLLPSAMGGMLIIGGIAIFAAFILWELRINSPVLDVRLFRDNSVFALSNLAALINYSATFGVALVLSMYLQYIQGYSPQEAGLILIAQPVLMMLLSPVAGRLSDRIEPRILATAGMTLTALSLGLLIFISETTSLSYFIGTLLILGAGLAIFSAPNTNAIMSSVEKQYYGVASATVGTMRLTGQMISVAIMTSIFAIYLGNQEIVPALYPRFMEALPVAFAIFTVLCIIGIAASAARGNVANDNA